MSLFEETTAVTSLGPGVYLGRVDPIWSAGTYPNGGALMALSARAIASAVEFADPLSLSCLFLRPAGFGACMVEVEVIRSGKSVAQAEAHLIQEQRERARMVAVFGDLEAATRDNAGDQVKLAPPDLPPPERCDEASRELANGLRQALLDAVELRFPPGTSVATGAEPSGATEISSWFRLRGGEQMDAYGLLLAVDAFLPVPVERGIRFWSPTLELTVHLRARPAPGWLRVRRSTRAFVGGYFDEDAEVWDSSDRLVAQSRQLARLGAWVSTSPE